MLHALPISSRLDRPSKVRQTIHSSNYLLTPCSRVLLEKLTGSTASQEIPLIFGTRRFLTVFTSARHLSLSWANSIQSSQPPPTSWRSILILSSHLRLGLPNGLFPSGPPRTLCTPLPSPIHATWTIFWLHNFSSLMLLPSLQIKYIPNNLSPTSSHSVTDQFHTYKINS